MADSQADILASPPVNLRDLGGIAAAGGTVRARFALRADDLTTIPEQVADDLVAGGLRAVIDLRSAEEFALTGRGPLGRNAAVSYHHIPFQSDVSSGARTAADMFDQTGYGPMYVGIVERATAQIVSALGVIAYAPGAVAFHCAAGQDRTGILAAFLLIILGADHDAVVADYVRTGENTTALQARLEPIIGPMVARRGLEIDAAARAALRKDFSAGPMLELLKVLVDRHGDPLAPLRAAGLDDGLISRLRARGLAPAGQAR